jgi:hypothetical protein
MTITSGQDEIEHRDQKTKDKKVILRSQHVSK